MRLFGFLRRTPPAPPPAPAAMVTTTTQPIALNPSDSAKIALAKYRIDAIDRHVAQHGAAGWVISEVKRREFEIERAMHVLALRAAGIEVS